MSGAKSRKLLAELSISYIASRTVFRRHQVPSKLLSPLPLAIFTELPCGSIARRGVVSTNGPLLV